MCRKKWVYLNRTYSLYAPTPEAIQAMYQFEEELKLTQNEAAKRVLTDLYIQLNRYEEAMELFTSIMDRSNKKDLKKMISIQEFISSPMRPPVHKPLKKAVARPQITNLPVFTYHHQDPIRTNALETGYLKTCSSCGTEVSVYYNGPFYTFMSYEAICPWCIADGSAAERLQGTFHDPTCCEHLDKDKQDELLHSYTWLSSMADYRVAGSSRRLLCIH